MFNGIGEDLSDDIDALLAANLAVAQAAGDVNDDDSLDNTSAADYRVTVEGDFDADTDFEASGLDGLPEVPDLPEGHCPAGVDEGIEDANDAAETA